MSLFCAVTSRTLPTSAGGYALSVFDGDGPQPEFDTASRERDIAC